MHARKDGLEIAIVRPACSDLGCDRRHRAQKRLLIIGAARLVQSEILNERKRSAGYERVCRALPADIGIDPVDRRGREDGLEVLVGESRVLEAGVHELKFARALKSQLGKPRQLSTRLDRRDSQASRQEAAGQLSSSTANLKHMVATLEAGGLASKIEQLLV